MDIYTAQDAVDRLLTFLQEAQNAPPKYNTSKNRYRTLAKGFGKCMCMVSKLLQEDLLGQDDEEFAGNRSDIQLLHEISDVQTNLEELSSFVSKVPNRELTVKDKKSVIHQYAAVLSQCTQVEESNFVVSTCLDLIWTWFDARFLSSNKETFRYKIDHLPEWVYHIVVCYGNSVVSGQDVDFENRFRSWCSEIKQTPCKYAVPYEVYQSYRSCGEVSLVSVVLWDEVYSKLLNKLSSCKVPIIDDAVFKLCESVTPDNLDNYSNHLVLDDVCNSYRKEI